MRAEPRAPLILEGGAFQRGRQQATARPEAGAAVRAAIRYRLAQAEALLAQPLARAYLADQRRFTAAHCPEAIAEIQGIAAGFDLAEDDVFAYLHLGALADLAGAAVPADGCTAWATPVPKGGALVAKNRDFRGEHAQIQEVFLHRDPAWGGREVLCVGSLGIPGAYSSGINSDGLALVDTQVATFDHGVGWLRYFLMSRLLATCADVAGALAAIREATHAGGGALVLADAGGSVTAVELGHGRIDIERPQEGAWVARTNHFLSPELESGNLQDVGHDPMADTSRARLETIRAALAAAVPAPESAGAVMATHGEGGREALCRHGEDGDARTISTSIYTCRPPQLLFSAGNPCTGPWCRRALTTRGCCDGGRGGCGGGRPSGPRCRHPAGRSMRGGQPMASMKIICPNGHLGFAPLKVESFERGVAAGPDYIAADSGSDDVGPGPLGADTSTSPLAWQTHDLEAMLLASRRLGVPMIIGSSGDTGTNSRVDRYVGIIRDLADKHGLPAFKLGYFYSEVDKEDLRARMRAGAAVEGLDGRHPLIEAELDATDRMVAMAGVHPYIELLDLGADVIIGGRSSDCAVFAAPAIHRGYPEALAYYLGKVLECASFCAEPYGAKETVLGEITAEDVKVTAMHPGQRCTIASVAGHAMYERANPFFEHVAGGMLDMTDCSYEQWDERSTRITGAHFIPAPEMRVKLEGSGKVGERYVGLVGIRDPYTIANVDEVIGWARQQVRERFGEDGYELHYTVYGRNGVMGELEPHKDRPAHELCIVVQGVAPTREMAEEVCMTGTRQMFYARLPDVKGTAGSVAFLLDEVLPASAAYRWTLNHTIPVASGLELFPVRMTTAGR